MEQDACLLSAMQRCVTQKMPLNNFEREKWHRKYSYMLQENVIRN